LKVKVRLHGRVRDLIGRDYIEVEGDVVKVRDVVNALIKALGPKANELGLKEPEDIVRPRVRVVLLINGFSVKMLGGLDTPLGHGDNVYAESVDVLEIQGGG